MKRSKIAKLTFTFTVFICLHFNKFHRKLTKTLKDEKEKLIGKCFWLEFLFIKILLKVDFHEGKLLNVFCRIPIKLKLRDVIKVI